MIPEDNMRRIDELHEEIRRNVRGTLRRNELMSKHTSFGIGGPADIWIEPETLADLLSLLNLCKKKNVPHVIFGRGTNLLVRDGGIRGIVISLGHACMQLRRLPDGVAAGAGASLVALVKFALHHELEGLEFCIGIPGSVGGALATNAGAWGFSISDCLQAALIFDPVKMERRRLEKPKLDFGYRRSNITSFGVVLEAEFALKTGNPAKISEKMEEYVTRRSNGQPLRSKNAGSVFKNPSGKFAGAIIEQLGYKGYRRGGAAVSDLHANFILNEKNAKAADVLAIVQEIKKRAEKELGIQLEEEIKIVGED